MADSDQIKVVIRVRPLIQKEQQNGHDARWSVQDEKMISQKDQAYLSPYVFDQIFDRDCSTWDLYGSIIGPIVDAAMNGYHGTVFAYGQSGSGKTHTMSGSRLEPGIIGLAMQDIFDFIEQKPSHEFLMRASYMEIYKEKIYDLLSSDERTLKLQETPDHQISVAGLDEKLINSCEQVFMVIRNGDTKRTVAETKQNDRSSRSHCIFRVIIESRPRNETDAAVMVSHLNFVDLAGSEKAGENSGDRFKEGCSINKSLFCLSQVISKLSEDAGNQFIPYRDSKLTRILQNALGGNSKTAIICTINPTTIEESHSTLKFATRAKTIKNKPHVNEVLSEAAMLKKYRNEISRLTKIVSDMGVQDMQIVNEDLRKQLEEHQHLIKQLKEQIVVSSTLPDLPVIQKKKQRRETWCAPKLRRTSHFPPLPSILDQRQITIREETFNLTTTEELEPFADIPRTTISFSADNESRAKDFLRLSAGRGSNDEDRKSLSPTLTRTDNAVASPGAQEYSEAIEKMKSEQRFLHEEIELLKGQLRDAEQQKGQAEKQNQRLSESEKHLCNKRFDISLQEWEVLEAERVQLQDDKTRLNDLLSLTVKEVEDLQKALAGQEPYIARLEQQLEAHMGAGNGQLSAGTRRRSSSIPVLVKQEDSCSSPKSLKGSGAEAVESVDVITSTEDLLPSPHTADADCRNRVTVDAEVMTVETITAHAETVTEVPYPDSTVAPQKRTFEVETQTEQVVPEPLSRRQQEQAEPTLVLESFPELEAEGRREARPGKGTAELELERRLQEMEQEMEQQYKDNLELKEMLAQANTEILRYKQAMEAMEQADTERMEEISQIPKLKSLLARRDMEIQRLETRNEQLKEELGHMSLNSSGLSASFSEHPRRSMMLAEREAEVWQLKERMVRQAQSLEDLQNENRRLEDLVIELRGQLNEEQHTHSLLVAKTRASQSSSPSSAHLETSLEAELEDVETFEQRAVNRVEMESLQRKLANQESQISRLEALLQERDEDIEVLFEKNVLVPKDVAEARIKEFEELKQQNDQLEEQIREKDSEIKKLKLTEAAQQSVPSPGEDRNFQEQLIMEKLNLEEALQEKVEKLEEAVTKNKDLQVKLDERRATLNQLKQEQENLTDLLSTAQRELAELKQVQAGEEDTDAVPTWSDQPSDNVQTMVESESAEPQHETQLPTEEDEVVFNLANAEDTSHVDLSTEMLKELKQREYELLELLKQKELEITSLKEALKPPPAPVAQAETAVTHQILKSATEGENVDEDALSTKSEDSKNLSKQVTGEQQSSQDVLCTSAAENNEGVTDRSNLKHVHDTDRPNPEHKEGVTDKSNPEHVTDRSISENEDVTDRSKPAHEDVTERAVADAVEDTSGSPVKENALKASSSAVREQSDDTTSSVVREQSDDDTTSSAVREQSDDDTTGSTVTVHSGDAAGSTVTEDTEDNLTSRVVTEHSLQILVEEKIALELRLQELTSIAEEKAALEVRVDELHATVQEKLAVIINLEEQLTMTVGKKPQGEECAEQATSEKEAVEPRFAELSAVEEDRKALEQKLEELEKIQREKEAADDRIEVLEAELSQLSASAKSLADLEEKLQEFDDMTAERNSLQGKVGELSDELGSLNATLQQVQTENAQFSGELDSLKSQLEQTQAEKEKLMDEMGNLNTEFSQLKEVAEEMKSELAWQTHTAEELQNKLEEVEQQKVRAESEAEEQIAKLTQESEELVQDLEKTNQLLEDSEQCQRVMQETAENHKKTIESLETNVEKLAAERDALELKEETAQEQQLKLQQQAEELESQRAMLERQLEQAEQSKRLLESILEERDSEQSLHQKLSQELQESQAEIVDLQAALSKLKPSLERQERKILLLEEAKVQLEEERDHLEEMKAALVAEKEKLGVEVLNTLQKADVLEKEVLSLRGAEKEKAAVQAQLDERLEELATLQSQARSLEQRAEAGSLRVMDLEQQLEGRGRRVKELEQQAEASREQLAELEHAVAAEREELAGRLRQQAEEARQQQEECMGALQHSLQQAQQRADRTEEECRSLQERSAQQSALIDQLKKDLDSAQSQAGQSSASQEQPSADETVVPMIEFRKMKFMLKNKIRDLNSELKRTKDKANCKDFYMQELMKQVEAYEDPENAANKDREIEELTNSLKRKDFELSSLESRHQKELEVLNKKLSNAQEMVTYKESSIAKLKGEIRRIRSEDVSFCAPAPPKPQPAAPAQAPAPTLTRSGSQSEEQQQPQPLMSRHSGIIDHYTVLLLEGDKHKLQKELRKTQERLKHTEMELYRTKVSLSRVTGGGGGSGEPSPAPSWAKDAKSSTDSSSLASGERSGLAQLPASVSPSARCDVGEGRLSASVTGSQRLHFASLGSPVDGVVPSSNGGQSGGKSLADRSPVLPLTGSSVDVKRERTPLPSRSDKENLPQSAGPPSTVHSPAKNPGSVSEAGAKSESPLKLEPEFWKKPHVPPRLKAPYKPLAGRSLGLKSKSAESQCKQQ